MHTPPVLWLILGIDTTSPFRLGDVRPPPEIVENGVSILMKTTKPDFDVSTGAGQKRLMSVSMGLDSETYIGKPIDLSRRGDYGIDPLGNGFFKMIPSGDVVDREEMLRRRPSRQTQIREGGER